jgi:glycosyltransferase involved in cell wall biosynthesis
MKISGFSIVRSGLALGYPFLESLRSALPLVDEMIVGVGDSKDGTWQALKRIKDPKLKLFHSVWDMSAREGGRVLSIETNKALARCSGDWGLYLQADEVLHENDLDLIRSSMARHLARRTEGLDFSYLHFYGSYQTLQDHRRKWYRRAVRVVRLGRGVESAGDAQGFKIRGRRLNSADSGARIFHYGWSRPPEVMLRKQMNLDRMYHDEAWIARRYSQARENVRHFYEDRGHLKFFQGSHPQVMLERVLAQDWSFDHQIGSQWPVWMRKAYVLLLFHLLKRFKK